MECAESAPKIAGFFALMWYGDARKLIFVYMATTLNVTKRGDSDSATVLRSAGSLPAVVYGPKQDPINLSVNARDFEVLRREAGESTIINLQGLDEEIEVLIQDVDFDAGKGGVSHIDFYAIERGKELTTNVPLEFTGEAPVEKTGATVNKVLHEVDVTCRPSALPEHISVDLSVIESESDQVKVSDLVLPEGVKVENDPESVVVSVSAAREEEPEESEAPDMDSIEVEQKGKEGDGEAAAE